MLCINNGCAAQSSSNDDNIRMLKDFYTEYCKLWSIKPVPLPNVLYLKLDSLQKRYCTQKIRTEAKEWFDDGHDLFTADWGIDVESLSTMSIVKDTVKENTYVVSYIVNAFPVSPDKPEKKKVSLYVGVIRDAESYKINSVK